MKRNPTISFFLQLMTASACLIFTSIAFAGDKAPGQIHDYPGDQTNAYAMPHQLGFEFPHDGLARAEFKSEAFYAIILKSAEKCSFTEKERVKIQKIFPENKVFMDLFNCDDPEENITYTNVNYDYAFIAVFGGLRLEEAQKLLEDYDLSTKFPGANIRKMQAVLVYS